MIKRFSVIGAVLLVLFLGACVGSDVPVLVKTKTTIAFVCKQIGRTLTELSVFREAGALTSGEISAIQGIKIATKPFCPKDAVILDFDVALAIVERQLVIAAAMQRKKDIEGN